MQEMEQANEALNEKVAELEASVSEKEAVMEAANAEHEAKVSELSAKVEEFEAKEVVYAEELAVAKEDIEAKTKALEDAELKLADPAHKAAQADGEADPVEVGAEEVIEGEVDPKIAAQAVIDEYAEVPEGIKRSEFIAERGSELQEAYNLLNQEG
jgi:chromosome segregation ATPase